MTPRIACFGELLWDVYTGARHLGGAPANVAFHASACGGQGVLVSRVGQDELGPEAVARMRANGVDVTHVSVDADRPTGQVRVVPTATGPTYVIEPQAAWDFIPLTHQLLTDAAQCDVLCFGTLAQRAAVSRGTLHGLLDHVHGVQRPPKVVLDLNLREPFVDLRLVLESIERADVIKLNEGEAEWLAEQLGVGNAAEWLRQREHVELVALTRGSRGAAIFSKANVVEHAGVASSGVDPVGAGDAFTACLALGLARRTPLPEILAVACERAAWVAARPGAMPQAT